MTETALSDTTKPIQDELAERACVACMMRDEGAADLGLTLLAAEDLMDYALRLVFQAVAHLRKSGHACGPDMLFTRLSDARQREAFGSDGNGGDRTASYLGTLWDAVPTGASLPYYAARVREFSLRRKLIHTARELIRDCEDGVSPAEEMAAECSERIAGIARPAGKRGPQPLAVLVATAVARYVRQGQGEQLGTFVKTGFTSLDQMTGGLPLGALTILAARPSVGKSALALRFCEAAAGTGGVLFISMEMTNTETIDRFIAGVTRTHLARLRGQQPMSDEQVGEIGTYLTSPWASLPVWIDDTPRQSLSRIISTIRLHVSRHKVRTVAVDYLGLISREDNRLPMHEHLGQCTSALKALASELGIAMVLLAQINRAADDRGSDSPPRLSDLKGSGDIEQDADMVLLLHRRVCEERDLLWNIDMILAKQRNGPTGTIPIQYFRPYVRFEEDFPIL